MLFKSKKKKQEELLINELGNFIYSSLRTSDFLIGICSPYIYLISKNVKIGVYKLNDDRLFKELSLIVMIKEYKVMNMTLIKILWHDKQKWEINESTKYYEIPKGVIDEIRSWIVEKSFENKIGLKKHRKECNKEEHSKIQEYINNLYENEGENKRKQ